RSFLTPIIAAIFLWNWPASARAESEPTLITYGKDAPTREGDFNHAQTIYLSVPDGLKERLWINIFDPGISSEYDQLITHTADSRTRFALFGGAGASAPIAGDPENATQDAASGSLIAEKTFGTEPEAVGQWRTITVVDPRQGEAVDGRRVFRLLVEGVSGDAGNRFEVAVSDRETRADPPQGLEVYSYRPTVRVAH